MEVLLLRSEPPAALFSMFFMPVVHRTTAPLSGWPAAAELNHLGSHGTAVILPDQVREFPDGLVAGFRHEAQAIRVFARDAGLPVGMFAPPSARRTLDQEHAADWVLPAVFSVPAGTMSALVATQIQRWLGRPGDEEEPAPTVRFRRAVISGDNVELLEIKGPADEVIAVLNAEAAPQPNSEPQGD